MGPELSIVVSMNSSILIYRESLYIFGKEAWLALRSRVYDKSDRKYLVSDPSQGVASPLDMRLVADPLRRRVT